MFEPPNNVKHEKHEKNENYLVVQGIAPMNDY